MDSRFFEIFKFAILICLLLIAAALFAEESTIIDTIWTENSLQGAIGYHVQNGTYYGGILSYGEYYVDIGDGYDQFSDFNDVCLRAYFSFPIEQIPADYVIDSIFIKVYQLRALANDLWGFPIWFENQYYPCSLFYVDYGLTFEPADFNPVIYDSLGAISTNSTNGWKQMDITSAYQDALQWGRQYCQIMLKFPILTDYDNRQDLLSFRSAYDEDNYIRLVLYKRTTTSVDEYINNTQDLFNIYPNPCRDYINIESKDDFKLTSIKLFNIKGELVQTDSNFKNHSKQAKLNINDSNLKNGIYIIQAKLSNHSSSTSITKKISVMR